MNGSFAADLARESNFQAPGRGNSSGEATRFSSCPSADCSTWPALTTSGVSVLGPLVNAMWRTGIYRSHMHFRGRLFERALSLGAIRLCIGSRFQQLRQNWLAVLKSLEAKNLPESLRPRSDPV